MHLDIFLLEITQQEIPSRLQKEFCNKFTKLAFDDLQKRGFLCKDATIEGYITSDRIVCIINGIKNDLLVKGPSINANKAALDGFLKKHLFPTTILKKDEYYFYNATTIKEVAHILGFSIPTLLLKAATIWPKRMTWDSRGSSWIRPINNILCMINDIIVPFEFSGVTSSNKTSGRKRNEILHYLSRKDFNTIEVKSASVYKTIMSNEGVILSGEDRSKAIFDQVMTHNLYPITREDDIMTSVIEGQKNTILEEFFISSNKTQYQNLFKNEDIKAVLDTMGGTVEHPFLVFDIVPDEFLCLPFDIISTTLIKNQFYLPAIKKLQSGKYKMVFCFVLDGEDSYTREAMEEIKRGNCKVLSARLSDAKFFFFADKEKFGNIKTLPQIMLQLDTMHLGCNKFGTLQNRCERIYSIAMPQLPNIDPEDIKKVIAFSQLDLVSNIVNEMPELQGLASAAYLRLWWSNCFKSQNILNTSRAIAVAQYGAKVKLDSIARVILSAIYEEKLTVHLAQGHRATASSDPYRLESIAARLILANNPIFSDNALEQYILKGTATNELNSSIGLNVCKNTDKILTVEEQSALLVLLKKGMQVVATNSICSTWNNNIVISRILNDWIKENNKCIINEFLDRIRIAFKLSQIDGFMEELTSLYKRINNLIPLSVEKKDTDEIEKLAQLVDIEVERLQECLCTKNHLGFFCGTKACEPQEEEWKNFANIIKQLKSKVDNLFEGCIVASSLRSISVIERAKVALNLFVKTFGLLETS